MALRVRDAASAAARFKSKASGAAGDYANGVKGAGAAWEGATKAAGQNYADGVQKAIGRDAFSKGVSNSGGNYYEARASGLGAQRFAQGVAAGEGNYAEGVAPYLQNMAGLNLTPRRPKGDPSNIQRVAEVSMSNRQLKERRA